MEGGVTLSYVLEQLYAQRHKTGDLQLCCAGSQCCEDDSCEMVHKSVLAAVSPVFEAMFYGSMIESHGKALESQFIMDPLALKDLVAVCYGQPSQINTGSIIVDRFEMLRALQIAYHLQQNCISRQDWPFVVWEMYAEDCWLTERDLWLLIGKGDPKYLEIISEYNLERDQLMALTSFEESAPDQMRDIYRTAALKCRRQVGSSRPFEPGDRVVYFAKRGSNESGGISPPAKSVGIVIRVSASLAGSKVVSIQFDEGVCNPNPYNVPTEQVRFKFD